MIHFTTEIESRMWGDPDKCEAQTIRANDEYLLIWHAFPENARSRDSSISGLMSSNCPEVRPDRIYLPGHNTDADYQVCHVAKLTTWNYQILNSIHLLPDKVGGPIKVLSDTNAIKIDGDNLKITLYRRGLFTGFIWEELHIDHDDLNWEGDHFYITIGRRTRLSKSGVIEINPLGTRFGVCAHPNQTKAIEAWSRARDDFIKLEEVL